jgi:hypothetical protein
MKRVRRVIAALRDFARGFLGIPVRAAPDGRDARQRLRDTAERRQHCC